MPTRRLPRSVALAAALTMLTASMATATIPDDAALPDDAVAAQRHEGRDRYETAARTALASHPDGASTAIIARGDDFPDGLAASYLAGAEDAPILLTAPTQLPFPTQDALQELGVRDAIIVGGPAAVSEDVAARIAELLGGEQHVDRVAGQTRFETAAYVFNRVGTAGTMTDLTGDSDQQLTTAVVASGRSFPDALAAGPLANAAGVPILLTEPDSLPQITRFAIDTGIEQILIAGGPVSVEPQRRQPAARHRRCAGRAPGLGPGPHRDGRAVGGRDPRPARLARDAPSASRSGPTSPTPSASPRPQRTSAHRSC